MGIFKKKPKVVLSQVIEEKKVKIQQEWSKCTKIIADLREKAGAEIMLSIIGDEMISRLKNMNQLITKFFKALDMSIHSTKLIESLGEINKQFDRKDSRMDELNAMTYHIIEQADINLEMIKLLHQELSDTTNTSALNE